MRKVIYFIFFVLFSNTLCSQTDKNKINGYKYAILETNDYEAKNILNKIGISTYFINDSIPENVYKNPCQTLHISFKNQYIKNPSERNSIYHYISSIIFKNCLRNDLLVLTKGGSSYDKSLKKTLKLISRFNYSYDVSLTPKINSSTNKRIDSNWWQNLNEDNISIKSNDLTENLSLEKQLKNYFDSNELDPIEGIWIFSNSYSGNYGRSAFKKDPNSGFQEIHLENLKKNATANYDGEIIASVRKMSSEGIYMITEDGVTNTAVLKGNLLEVFYAGAKATAIREYPNNDKSKNKNIKPGEWAGNGSGIIISKSGHIVTNHHVIEGVDDIEVEFILNEEVQKFNAEVVQVDKVNDLAIIKIFDINFDGVEEPPYNFKTRTSDVGTKVYAFGYPMALTAMGKEIKITDGIISSKSGFDGNITTYQITAPIQGGNSGGPLFDENGNLLGINSSGIRKDVADNVGYTIKSSYILNLIDVLPKSIDLPSSTKLESLTLTEQIKEISKYVVLIKVK